MDGRKLKTKISIVLNGISKCTFLITHYVILTDKIIDDIIEYVNQKRNFDEFLQGFYNYMNCSYDIKIILYVSDYDVDNVIHVYITSSVLNDNFCTVFSIHLKDKSNSSSDKIINLVDDPEE